MRGTEIKETKDIFKNKKLKRKEFEILKFELQNIVQRELYSSLPDGRSGARNCVG